MEIAKQIAGFSPAEADDLRKAIGKKIHSLMASLKSKFLEGCAASGTAAGRRAAALGRHGAGAGLLLQQVARRLLRAHLVPHRLAAREPPARVHGGAHLVRDEHEGQGAVLRRRVRRARDRGAAARRERVPGRLRGRRGEDPLRAQRGEERRRGRPAARSSRRARRAGRSRRSGTSPSASTRRSRTSARSSRSSACGALDSTGASRKGMLHVLEDALSYGQKQQQDRLLGQASIFDLGDSPATTSARHHASIPDGASSRRPSCCGSRRRASASTSPSTRSARSATSCGSRTDCTLAELERRREGETVLAGGHRRRHCARPTTKKGEPMAFVQLEDLTGSVEVVVFNSTYAAARELLVEDAVLIVKGRVDHKQQGETKLVALEVSAFRGRAGAARGAAEGGRPQRARRSDPRARRRRARIPRRSAGLRRSRHVARLETAGAGPGVPRRPAARLLRLGPAPARRCRRPVGSASADSRKSPRRGRSNSRADTEHV